MNLASAPGVYDRDDQASLRGALRLADAQNLKRGKAETALYLRSPNDTVWKITVSDAGAVTATALA